MLEKTFWAADETQMSADSQSVGTLFPIGVYLCLSAANLSWETGLLSNIPQNGTRRMVARLK